MWRVPAVSLGLLVAAWLEFAYFPGHTYLAASSQTYIAALEHLDAPGYLSRDLVAIHPDFALTIYDELTLFWHEITRLSIAQILLTEQLVSRAAALFGIFLLARSTGVSRVSAIAISVLLNAGTFLPGPNIWLVDPEPVPRGVAFGPVMLAAGLVAARKPVAAALAGGYALLLDPVLAAPFWIALIVAFACDREMRQALRPVGPILLVFVLLLANLAQLQQGIPSSQPFFSRTPEGIANLLKFRSPELWISLWPSKYVYLYPSLLTLGIAGVTRIWSRLNRPAKWILLMLPLAGILTIPLSAVLLDAYRWAAIPQFAPLQLLVYTVALIWFVFATAIASALENRRIREAAVWSIFAAGILALQIGRHPQAINSPDISKLAQWAEASTWGSSMFAFPDAGKASYPGRFRAESRRAVWVDWQGGSVIDYDPMLAPEWQHRWHSTMEQSPSGTWLQQLLAQPIDYFVFDSGRRIEAVTQSERRTVRPAFEDQSLAVYEASTLRSIPGTLSIKQR